ncbi:unnamed protein product [Paramecium primaurelia]|uniref:Uncharacterized protein n=1 Tax=Paramecium primaurelia TaxID=5886 RepID=A0A8S1PKK0_PARPR|nr:unnamed protein product [Paramecium primaurelia]
MSQKDIFELLLPTLVFASELLPSQMISQVLLVQQLELAQFYLLPTIYGYFRNSQKRKERRYFQIVLMMYNIL